MNSWDVFGHDWAVEMLQGHLTRGSLRHAYLFTGPTGVGRRTLALRLAQALNCPSPSAPGVPCCTCRTCQQIEAGQNADLMVVQAENEGGTLRVEQVREVQKFLSLRPYFSAYKVVLLLRFQEANLNAQNALLKTLEEAPDFASLLLTADNAEQLLPTIVSRCEILRLHPLRTESVAEFLAAHAVESDKARLLAHLADGRPGYALRLSQDEKALAFRAEKLDDLTRLLASKGWERFDYAMKLAKDKDAFRQALLVWLSYWRDVLMKTCDASIPLTNADRAKEIEALAHSLDIPRARLVTEKLERAVEQLEKNVNARLLAEVILMDWPHLSL